MHHYTSHLSLPYTTPSLPLRTYDLHIPTSAPSLPSYTIIYIHGGAFRDPIITSQSLVPALQHLFSQSSDPPPPPSHIKAIASINYRLSPYPTHPTHPSFPDDESRNAKWPDHVSDVRHGIRYVSESAESTASIEKSIASNVPQSASSSGIILVGHSVGATIAFALAMNLDGGNGEGLSSVKAVVGVEGVYDFTAMRDAHVEHRSVYEEICEGAFGLERDGGWEEGNIVRAVEGRERE
ncbi:MAG: hypothetical protein Q9183_005620, partial [Haloplaca sp. 2 TL-2023]